MPAPIAQILTPFEFQPDGVERIAHRKVSLPIVIVEPKAEWAQQYTEVEARVREALGDRILDIAHSGSTSVPGLPAKDVIDVDLSLKDVTDEGSYVKALEDAGFRFLIREPSWYQHRFFVEDWPGAFHVNLHVWGPDSPEVARHRILRDWLRKTPEDLQLYAEVKRGAAEQATATGESMMEYSARKHQTIEDILKRAFRDLGYIE